LAKSRPTAVNLFWALERMKKAKDLKAEAEAIFAEDLAGNRAMGKARRRAHPAGRARHDLLQYRRAGDGGTRHGPGSDSSSKHKKYFSDRLRTRPYCRARVFTAWECVQEGIPCTLITDNMAGHLISRGEVDLVIVAPTASPRTAIPPTRSVPTRWRCWARRHNIPFYVAAPLSTFDPKIPDGSHIPIEER